MTVASKWLRPTNTERCDFDMGVMDAIAKEDWHEATIYKCRRCGNEVKLFKRYRADPAQIEAWLEAMDRGEKMAKLKEQAVTVIRQGSEG